MATKNTADIEHPLMKPTSFRLPQRGNDPYFGLSKASWYVAEKRGLVTMRRLVQPGKSRGITLVDYASAENYIQSVFGKTG